MKVRLYHFAIALVLATYAWTLYLTWDDMFFRFAFVWVGVLALLFASVALEQERRAESHRKTWDMSHE